MDPRIEEDLKSFSQLKLVSGRAIRHQELMTDVINVGVTFRTDSNGSAHTDHDCAAIRQMNDVNALLIVSAGNLYRDAQSRLREYGVTI